MRERRPPNLAQYLPTTVLDSQQLSEWLGCSVDVIERGHIPCAFLGPRRRIFIVGQVLAFLQSNGERAADGPAPHTPGAHR